MPKRYDAISLIAPANFIQAIRDSGYVSISTALAELIDNSVQAGATTIDISIDGDTDDGWPSISVEDDGRGMSTRELRACLQFGGTSRFDSRDSLGRFGMGLPAASLSQARQVEVTAWQRDSDALSVHLDVDSIAAGAGVTIEVTGGDPGQGVSGCRVVWRGCDRLDYKKLGWLRRALHRDLGRIFRRFLSQGLRVQIDGEVVLAVDPMMLDTRIRGVSASFAFEPLEYEIRTSSGTTGRVKVTFAVLPVAAWHDLDNATKRRAGIIGRDCVSVLRAGREIATGWYLMGDKRKANYDDWWRCEIEFEPELDEDFGITVNKQGIRPSSTLREALEPELSAIAVLLNARVQRSFERVKFEAATQASCLIAAAADSDLPVIHGSSASEGPLRYRFGVEHLSGESMLRVTLQQRRLNVAWNEDHPAFAALYKPLQDLGAGATDIRIALELLILSLARSAETAPGGQDQLDHLLTEWGRAYSRMLRRA